LRLCQGYLKIYLKSLLSDLKVCGSNLMIWKFGNPQCLHFLQIFKFDSQNFFFSCTKFILFLPITTTTNKPFQTINKLTRQLITFSSKNPKSHQPPNGHFSRQKKQKQIATITSTDSILISILISFPSLSRSLCSRSDEFSRSDRKKSSPLSPMLMLMHICTNNGTHSHMANKLTLALVVACEIK
jgi:hypothetical protein